MVKALIVEDEHYIRKGLIAQLQGITDKIEIIGECETVADAVTVARVCKPELVFLDVNLKDGTGFDFLEQIKEITFSVIFVTAYQEYALQALKNGALDYILKPVDIDELKNALDKFSNKTQLKDRIQIATEHFSGNKSRIVLSMAESFQIIDFKDLMYCKSESGYTTFFTNNKQKYIVSKPLKEFESQLPETIFFRTHQSYIVNLQYVDKFDRNSIITLKDKTEIPVSVRKKNEFIEKISK